MCSCDFVSHGPIIPPIGREGKPLEVVDWGREPLPAAQIGGLDCGQRFAPPASIANSKVEHDGL